MEKAREFQKKTSTSALLTTPNEMQKSKMAEEASQTAVKKREVQSKGEKERYTHLNAEFQRIARRDRKPSSVINSKK